MANESVSISQHARFARGTNATQNFRFLAERWTLARLRHQRVFSLVELSAAIRRDRGAVPQATAKWRTAPGKRMLAPAGM